MKFLQRLRDAEKSSRITIENTIDYGPEPEDFTYISVNRPTCGIVINDTPILYCDCDENCDKQHSDNKNRKCCYENIKGKLAYNSLKRLRLDRKIPIIECNRLCKCGLSCINRVVQNGIKVPLCIFKTSDGRGWGVKALQPIPK